jgi:hypothetical protein
MPCILGALDQVFVGKGDLGIFPFGFPMEKYFVSAGRVDKPFS